MTKPDIEQPGQQAPELTPKQIQRKKDAKKWLDSYTRNIFSIPGIKFKPRPKPKQ